VTATRSPDMTGDPRTFEIRVADPDEFPWGSASFSTHTARSNASRLTAGEPLVVATALSSSGALRAVQVAVSATRVGNGVLIGPCTVVSSMNQPTNAPPRSVQL
jgi:hypothetical protein